MWYRNLSDDIFKKHDIICHPMSWIPTPKVPQLVKFLTRWNMHSPDGIKPVVECCFNPIGTVFAYNKQITSFRGFKLFTGIKVLGEATPRYVSFSNCTNLETIELPNSLVILSYQSFFNTGLKEITIPINVREILGESIIRNHKLTTVILLPETPPKIGNSSIHGLNENLKYIYVPDSSITQYKQEYSSFWLAKLIRPLSEYHP